MTPDATEPAPFVWPPRSPEAPVLVDLPADEAPPPPRPMGLLEHVEADLLGVRSVSFGRWARASGWRPDAFGSFCWRCADSVGPHEVDGTGCGACRGRRLAWDRAARLGVYEGGLRGALMELKFGRWRRTGAELGAAMGERLGDMLGAGGFRPEEAVIVPVPPSWRRRMARGIDHTWVLARGAGRRAGVRVVPALARRHRPTQVGLSATARAANIRGAFRVRARFADGEALAGRVVVVLDDVRTTGATMVAACRAVRPLVGPGVEVWALTAMVASDRRPAPPVGAGSGGSWAGRHEKIAKSFAPAV